VFHPWREVTPPSAKRRRNVFAATSADHGLGTSRDSEFVVSPCGRRAPPTCRRGARLIWRLLKVPAAREGCSRPTRFHARISPAELDRGAGQARGRHIADIFLCPATAMGGTYTNYFNLFGFGAHLAVKVQAERPPRTTINDVTACACAPLDPANCLPLQAVADLGGLVTAPSFDRPLQQCALCDLTAPLPPGSLRVTPLAAMCGSPERPLPESTIEWRQRRLQRRPASGQT